MIRSKRTKIKKVLFWTSCIAIAMFVFGYFALDYGVNRMLQSMVSDNDRQVTVSEHDEEKFTVPGDPDDDPSTDLDDQKEPSGERSLPDVNVPPVPSTDQNESSNKEGSSSQEVDHPQGDGGSSSGQSDKPELADRPSNDAYSGVITKEKLEKAKEEITLRERTKVASVLLKKLSASDVKQLMGMSSMTIDEKKEAKKLILDKLSEEEYDELITIAAKLGLSQGKQYSDSLKEFK